MNKTELSVVQFDRDIKGPGDQQKCKNTSTYAYLMGGGEMLIEYDPAGRTVTLFDGHATLRDTIIVPLERVVRMEPLSDKQKADRKKAADEKAKAGKAAA